MELSIENGNWYNKYAIPLLIEIKEITNMTAEQLLRIRAYVYWKNPATFPLSKDSYDFNSLVGIAENDYDAFFDEFKELEKKYNKDRDKILDDGFTLKKLIPMGNYYKELVDLELLNRLYDYWDDILSFEYEGDLSDNQKEQEYRSECHKIALTSYALAYKELQLISKEQVYYDDDYSEKIDNIRIKSSYSNIQEILKMNFDLFYSLSDTLSGEKTSGGYYFEDYGLSENIEEYALNDCPWLEAAYKDAGFTSEDVFSKLFFFVRATKKMLENMREASSNLDETVFNNIIASLSAPFYGNNTDGVLYVPQNNGILDVIVGYYSK